MLTTYGEFYKEVMQNPNKNYYVRTHKDELTRVNAVCQKETEMFHIVFDNETSLECGDNHVFMGINGEYLLAKDLVIHSRILTTKGSLIVKSIKKSKNRIAYDISIDSPHWYVNDERGIIHHNTGFALLLAAAFLKKYPEGIMLFYDSEFGTPRNYFEAAGIDLNRVVHTPVTNLEELRHDIMNQLEGLERTDHVIIVVDSLGNLASKKEVNDAISGNEAADMTRAKVAKSLFRIITPHLSLKDIPFIGVAHTYQTMEMYSKTIVSGGTGILLAADNLWVLGRQQDKDAEGIQGYNFIINVEKSRYVKEKAKIPISVSYANGIARWSGLKDIALEGGYLTKPSKGWYALVDKKTGEVGQNMREADFVDSDEFWENLFKTTDIKEFIKNKYQLPLNITNNKQLDEEIEEMTS